MSAGHVLKELDELYAHPQVKINDSFVVDCFSAEAKHPGNIPFSNADSRHHWVHKDGLDYGMIVLSQHYRQLLEANNIQPFGVENWIRGDIDGCKGFILLGIPAELVSLEDTQTLNVCIGTVLIPLTRLTHIPPGVEETYYPRFFGETIQDQSLSSLKGTSGGPIIGFWEDNGRLLYRIVAIQSTSVGTKIVVGCPVRVFGNIVLQEIQELAAADSD